MSVDFSQHGNLQPPVTTALSTADPTDVFTVTGTQTYKVALIKVANSDTANNCEVSLFWNDGTSNHLMHFADVAAGTTIDVQAPVRLGDGQKARKIVAEAENAGDLTVTVFSVLDATQASAG